MMHSDQLSEHPYNADDIYNFSKQEREKQEIQKRKICRKSNLPGSHWPWFDTADLASFWAFGGRSGGTFLASAPGGKGSYLVHFFFYISSCWIQGKGEG